MEWCLTKRSLVRIPSLTFNVFYLRVNPASIIMALKSRFHQLFVQITRPRGIACMLQGHAGVSCSIVIDVTRKERNVYIHIIDYERLVNKPGLKVTVMKSLVFNIIEISTEILTQKENNVIYRHILTEHLLKAI